MSTACAHPWAARGVSCGKGLGGIWGPFIGEPCGKTSIGLCQKWDVASVGAWLLPGMAAFLVTIVNIFILQEKIKDL